MSLETSPCREEPDDRELIRLDLVGLAAEVATLSDRIQEELAGVSRPEAALMTATRLRLCERARSVLDPEADFASISTESLRSALQIMKDDQQQMLELRAQVSAVLDDDRTVPCDLELFGELAPAQDTPTPGVS